MADPPIFEPFVARPPWWGGDLQTIRNWLVAGVGLAPEDPRAEVLHLPAGDGSGDRMIGLLSRPETETRPLAVLVHGLAGSASSLYMRMTARHLLDRGYPVLRLNLRGAGVSAMSCTCRYNAGQSGDIADALGRLEPSLMARGAFIVGFSLGGNILLKFLAEQAGQFPILAAASVSAPIDLAASARRIMAPRNWLYHKWLLAETKRAWAGAVLTEGQRRGHAEARSMYEFDDRVVGPCAGFSGADEYYARCMGLRFLDRIKVPTLVIHAVDDPWIPVSILNGVAWPDMPCLTPLIADGGGHVGFHGRGGASPWHDTCIAGYFAAATA